MLSLQTDSHPDSLADARRRVRDAMAWTRVGKDVAADLEVAVGEILSNVHRHAYRGTTGPVRVEVHRSAIAVTVLIKDDGFATVVPSVPRTLPGGPESGGRGLYLAARLVDDVDIQPNPTGQGITIRLTKRVRDKESGASSEPRPSVRRRQRHDSH